MENKSIIQLNVREILEDIELQLVNIGVYNKPILESEDFGFYHKETYRELITKGETYTLVNIDGVKSQQEYKGTIKSFNYFRHHQVYDSYGNKVYSPFGNITFSRVCHAETLTIFKDIFDHSLKMDLPLRFCGRLIMARRDLALYVLSLVFPEHIGYILKDDVPDEVVDKNPLVILMYNVIRIIENIVTNSELSPHEIYAFVYKEGFIYLESLGDYRIIEWEMIQDYIQDKIGSDTSREYKNTFGNMNPLEFLCDTSPKYVEYLVSEMVDKKQRQIWCKLIN